MVTARLVAGQGRLNIAIFIRNSVKVKQSLCADGKHQFYRRRE